MHRIGALAHQPHAFVEPERASGRERRVLAETVPCTEARFEATSLSGVEHHQARHERRELGVARVFQLLGIGVEQQSGDVALGNLGRLVNEFPALVVDPGPAHTRSL